MGRWFDKSLYRRGRIWRQVKLDIAFLVKLTLALIFTGTCFLLLLGALSIVPLGIYCGVFDPNCP